MLQIILGFFSIVIFIFSFYIIDRLLEYEHKNYYHQWVADGKPRGFLWYPKDYSTHIGHFARSSKLSSWLFITPEWIQEDSKAKLLLWTHRLSLMLIMILWIFWKIII